jgi:DNA relaxase NicK
VETHDHKNVRTRATRLSTTEVHQSAVTDHMNNLNHIPDWNSAKVVCKESNTLDRQILESITIRKTEEIMNRDEGAYQLSHAYDNLQRLRAAPNHRARPRPPTYNKH